MIAEGYDLDPTGPPSGICQWCWRSTWSVAVSPFTGVIAPCHVTCVMQMNIIRKKLRSGRREPPPGRHVAWQRYYRLQRVALRHLKGGQNYAAALLMPPTSDDI